MSSPDFSSDFVRVAERAFTLAAEHLYTNAGDTLSVTLAIPPDIRLAIAGADGYEQILRPIVDELGLAVSYTAGASTLVLTRVNMPATNATTVGVSPEELLVEIRDLLAHIVAQQDRVDLGSQLAFVTLLFMVVIEVFTAMH